MYLNELKTGQRAQIIRLAVGDKMYRQRLMAMGLLPGTLFTFLRTAPLGDPIVIAVRGVELCLRKAEAGLLRVKVVAM